MPAKHTILGLDLGTASLGWALIEYDDKSSGRIIGSGVRIFPEALEGQDESSKKPKNVARRDFRLARRQTRRRAWRKSAIKKILREAGMLPSSKKDVLEQIHEKGKNTPSPYTLRSRAMESELELHELGRAIFHLSRRIGFGGSPKRRITETEPKELTAEEKKEQKEEQKAKEKREALKARIIKSGLKTLGAYLSQEETQRDRHLSRQMLLDEFEAIWEAQKKFHGDVLTDKLRNKLHDVIFHREPIFWHWATVGKCEIDLNSEPLMKADWLAQEFTMLQDLNNLRLAGGSGRPLDDTERKLLLNLFRRKAKPTFPSMRKELKPYWKEQGIDPHTKFNFEIGQDERKNLSGNAVDAMLINAFQIEYDGTSSINEILEEIPRINEIRNQIAERKWHIEYRKVEKPSFRTREKETRIEILDYNEIDAEKKKFIEAAMKDWGITEEQAQALADDKSLPSGWLRFSRKVIDTLLPDMKTGMGMTETLNKHYPEEERLRGSDDRPFLPSHHSVLPDIRNPVVTRCLNEVRKVVNNIIREYGKPDYIRIELARDVKLAGKAKARALKVNKRRRKLNDDAVKWLKENNIDVNKWSIRKHVLWEESGHRDIYSGDTICCDDLFRKGEGEYQIEHILPRSRSQDDSLNNLLLCRRDLNQQKGNRTPFEAFGKTDLWGDMVGRINDLCKHKKHLQAKKERFLRQNYAEKDEERSNRQLTDTAYAAKAARAFLACLYPKGEAIAEAKGRPPRVQATNGRITNQLGSAWNIYKQFNKWFCNDTDDKKHRDDHRHHALDAVIVALTSPSKAGFIATHYNRDRKKGIPYEQIEKNLPFRPPWKNFHQDLKESLDNIIVSYRVDSKTTGALTAENQLGRHKNSSGEAEYVQRKDLKSITPSAFLSIRDKEVRAILWTHVRDSNPELSLNLKYAEELISSKTSSKTWKNTPAIKQAFKQAFADESKFPYMPNKAKKNGKRNIIKSVRITVGGTGKPVVKSNKTPKSFYATGDNHHVALYKKPDGGIEPVAVSKLEARRRLRKGEKLVSPQHPQHGEGWSLLCVLYKRDVLAKIDPETKYPTYWRVEVLGEKQMTIRPHTDASTSKKQKVQPSYTTFNYKKVSVDPIGKVHPAK